jgi:hypothetical protein
VRGVDVIGFRQKAAAKAAMKSGAIHYSSLASKPLASVIRYLFDSCSRTIYLGWKAKRHPKQAARHR